MITEENIARINFLAKKLKTEGLTCCEAEEQKTLRRAFIDNIKAQVKQQLECIEYVDDKHCDHKHEGHKHEGHKHHKHQEGCGCGKEHDEKK